VAKQAKKKGSVSEVWTWRAPERAALWQAFAASATGFLTLLLIRWANSPTIAVSQFSAVAVYAVTLVVVHVVLVFGRFRGDQALLVATMLLGGVGVMMQERMGTYGTAGALRASAFAYPIGVAAMLTVVLVCKRGRWALLDHLHVPAALSSMLLLGGILLLGRRYRGMVFAPGQANPAEFVKPMLIVFLAGFLSRSQKAFTRFQAGLPAPPLPELVGLGVLWGGPMLLLVLQRDVGMLFLLNAVLVVMLLVSTGRWGYPLVAALVTVALGALVMHLPMYGRQRMVAWVAPFSSPTGSGWQILQSLSALFAGGLWGTGLGMGFPAYIPIASSDFVYAAIGEELGYVGCLLVVLAYLVLLYRGYRIAAASKRPFPLLLATGLATLLAFQVMLNIGGVIKAFPLTGITLPFISHGGSSLVTCFVISGILLAVSEDTAVAAKRKKGGKKARRPRKKATGKGRANKTRRRGGGK